MFKNKKIIIVALLDIASLVLIVLKVSGIINIGWGAALSPIWIPSAIIGAALLFCVVAVLLWGDKFDGQALEANLKSHLPKDIADKI